MPSYNSNHDLVAYDSAQQSYTSAHDSWAQTEAQRQAAYDDAYAEWQQGEGGTPAPLEPTPLPEPQPPPVPGVYTTRDVTEPEVIATATGDALVIPPRAVLTAPDGTLAAISHDELDASYTPAPDE